MMAAMADHDPYAALRLPNYLRFFTGSFVANVGLHMQATAVGWDIFERTGSEMALGLAGLAQFLPVLPCFLWAGHVADRFNRRRIVMGAQTLVGLASLGLAIVAHYRAAEWMIYALLVVTGIARSFLQPAKHALIPLLVPETHFTNAVTWNSSGFHLASVLGPALGGWVIYQTRSAQTVYLADAAAALFYVLVLATVTQRRVPPRATALNLSDLSAGFRFVWNHPIILGALSLDLFAVLLGGAVTLLPVYAKNILMVGPDGLGWLRGAPAFGALAMGMLLAHRPPVHRVGHTLLWSVAGFGLATIVFGFSKSYLLSLSMLFLLGALDNISVIIRHTLVQTLTPDELRGRVSAVNSVFIGASNELGGFESGLVAHYFGAVFSVVSGGLGTLAVVAAIAYWLPPLRNYGQSTKASADAE